MAKFKKALLICTVYVLVASLAIGGTYAYLTSNDGQTNVMALGKVEIEQLEYERVVENGAWVPAGATDKYGYTPDMLQEFVQNKPIFPAVFADGVIKWDDRNGSDAASGAGSHQQSWGQIGASGSNQLFDESVKNVIDKFVFVKNTGETNAYVRTLIAYEQGSIEADNFKNIIMTNANKNHWDWETVGTDVVINGNKYVVMCATYLGPKSNPTGILAPDAVSYPSLLQVYMKPEATNEDCKAIDGNKNGTYDILVLSQAVQSEGFSEAKATLNEAFGKPEDKVVEWFSDIKVPGKNPMTLEEMCAEGGAFTMTENSAGGAYKVEEDANASLNLDGNTLKGDSLIVEGELEVNDGTIEAGFIRNHGVIEINDVTINGGETGYAVIGDSGSETVINNANITATSYGCVAVNGGSKLVFNSGKVVLKSTATSGRYNFYVVGEGSTLEINDGDFSIVFNKTATSKQNRRSYVYAGDGATVVINGGTFGKASTVSGYPGILTAGTGMVIIKGGTFGFNPSNWVADGYEAVQTGSTWTVSAK